MEVKGGAKQPQAEASLQVRLAGRLQMLLLIKLLIFSCFFSVLLWKRFPVQEVRPSQCQVIVEASPGLLVPGTGAG